MKKLGVQLMLALALAALPAAALAEYWKYETEDGTVAFTDEPKHIPARYRDGATQHQEKGLAEYERATLTKAGAARETKDTRLDPERIGELVPAYGGAQVAASPAANRTAGNPVRVRLNLGAAGWVETDVRSDAPIEIDRRYLSNDKGITTPHMVVSQGGEVLAIIDDFGNGQIGE